MMTMITTTTITSTSVNARPRSSVLGDGRRIGLLDRSARMLDCLMLERIQVVSGAVLQDGSRTTGIGFDGDAAHVKHLPVLRPLLHGGAVGGDRHQRPHDPLRPHDLDTIPADVLTRLCVRLQRAGGRYDRQCHKRPTTGRVIGVLGKYRY